MQAGDKVLFTPPVPSWSRYLKFTVNSKYYSIGTVQCCQGQFTTVVDMTGEQFTVFSHQVVLLTAQSTEGQRA